MKYYFILQYKILIRYINTFNIYPIISISILLLSFIFLSEFLFIKSEFAKYIYPFIAINFIYKVNTKNRDDLLKTIFTRVNYLKIRLLESVIIILPFILFMLYKKLYTISIILIIISFCSIFIRFRTNYNYTIPTPFGKQPFEFTIGFRKTFLIILIIYFISIQSINYDNLNLGLFTILALGFVIISYYSETENEYFVWIFNTSAKEFIFKKIKLGIYFSTTICLPVLLLLISYYPENILLILSMFVLKCLFVISIILMKYYTFPNNMGLPEAILIVVCFSLPFLLIAFIPIIYIKTIENLNYILKK